MNVYMLSPFPLWLLHSVYWGHILDLQEQNFLFEYKIWKYQIT